MAMFGVIFLCLLLSFGFLSESFELKASLNFPPENEMMALQDFYNSTGGAHWLYFYEVGIPWNFTDGSSPCDAKPWYGITCVKIDSTNHIEVLDLVASNLVGFIPDSIGEFSYLTELDVDLNSLNGTLPTNLGLLSRLESFSASYNDISGTLPDSLGNWTNLNYLESYSNNLSGTIPETFNKLTKMVYFWMDQNALSGTLPSFIGEWPDLESLYVNQNLFNGSLPAEIGNCVLLSVIDIYDNMITGSIPESFCDLIELSYLLFNENNLSGTIPSCIGNLNAMQYFEIEENAFVGTLPSSMSNMKQLIDLYVGENHFTGTIPSWLSDFASLSTLSIYSNSFNGSIPDSVCSLDLLEYFVLGDNLLTGSIPSCIGQLVLMQEFEVYTTQITGTIPTELCSAPQLTYLYLYQNLLSQSIPSCFGNMTELLEVDFFINDLTGSIPDSFAGLNQLEYLNLCVNQLSGTVPSFISSWHNLRGLILYSNKFYGTLPATFNTLTSFHEFDIGENHLFGSIPSELSSHATMAVLLLYSNYLDGSLPAFGSHSVLTQFEVDYNHLTGSIPTSIENVQSMVTLAVGSNDLNGTLPEGLGRLTKMIYFSCNFNMLTGQIPSSMSKLADLATFNVKSNSFTGPLPEWIENCFFMIDLQFGDNHFTGTIPPLSKLHLLNYAAMQSNLLDGTVPDSICDLQNLESVLLYENNFHGTIPECIGNLTKMNTLTISYNSLTGFLPSTIGELAALVGFELINNQLEGSIPSSIGQLSNLTVFTANGNMFTGSVSNAISLLSKLQYLDLSDNLFSGTIPPELSQVETLSTLLLNSNKFSGSITKLFNSSLQTALTAINLNSNQLTGSVPDEIYRLSSLKSLFLVSNCLQASLSDAMCSLKQLNGLVLDGIGTASGCRVKFFPEISGSTSYTSKRQYRIEGSIPACLFTLPLLETLHLSGNDMSGSLPELTSIHPTLLDLSLSHNSLSGTLPLVLQQHRFKSMDVSFNRFTGHLDSSYNRDSVINNASAALQVNRLSGTIPSALIDAETVVLVDGNMFTCGIINRDAVPKADPDHSNYQCGSNAFDLSSILFVASICGCAVFGAYVMWKSQSSLSGLLVFSFNCQDQCNIATMYNELIVILKSFAYLVALILVLFLPTYGGLSSHYSTYYSKYAWVISAAYLGGVTPGAVLLVLYLLLVGSFVWMSLFWKQEKKALSSKSLGKQTQNVATLMGLGVVNLVIVAGVNILYVYILLNSQSQFVDFCIVLLTAGFKVLWNEQCLPRMLTAVGISDGTLSLKTFLQLFNYIVTPILVFFAVSPNCFYYVFANSAPVTSTVEYYGCSNYFVNGTCESFGYYPIQSVYTPPFNYNYQCMSTLVADYSSVFVYTCLFSATKPLYMTLLQRIILKNPEAWIGGMLPRLQRPPSTRAISGTNVKLFSADKLVMKYVASLALMLSFGVMLPLLSVAILIDVAITTWFTLYSIKVLLDQSDKELASRYQSVLNSECTGVLSRLYAVTWILVPFMSIFYSVFLWDIVGDEVGFVKALWAPILMTLLPTVSYAALDRWETVKRRNASFDIEIVKSKGLTVVEDDVENPIV